MAQSSPGSYRQVIGHVDRVSKLQAEQKRDRAADIEHNRQIADAHRKRNKSWEWGVDLEGKSRDVVLKLDAMVRGVSYDMEMKSIQQARESAVNNAYAKSDAKKAEMDQLTGLVKQVTGVASQYIKNRQAAEAKQVQADADKFQAQYGSSIQQRNDYTKISTAQIADEQREVLIKQFEADYKISYGDYTTAWEGLSPAAQNAVHLNNAHRALGNIEGYASADTGTKIGGRNYLEWQGATNIPGKAEAVQQLLRGAEQGIYRGLLDKGIQISQLNPQIRQQVNSNIGQAVNRAYRDSAQQAELTRQQGQDEVMVQRIREGGSGGVTSSWNDKGHSDPDVVRAGGRKQIITNDLDSVHRLIKAGVLENPQQVLNEFKTSLWQDRPLSDHPTFGKQLLEMQKSLNAVENIQHQTIAQEKKGAILAATNYLNKLKDRVSVPTQEIENTRQWLAEKGLLTEQNEAILNGVAGSQPESQAVLDIRTLVDTHGKWTSTNDIRNRGKGLDPEVVDREVNKVTAARNKDEWYQRQKKYIDALAAGALGVSGETARDQESYHTVVPIIRRKVVDLMQGYISNGMTEVQAQGQVEAWLQELGEKADKEPFGNHILGVFDQAKDRRPGFKEHYKVDKIVPLQNPGMADISQALTPHIQDVYTNPKGVQEYIRTNGSALNGIVSTEDATEFLNKHYTGKPVSRRTLNIFTDVGTYTGTGASQAAIDFLKGKGINYQQPTNQAYEELSKKMDAAILETAVNMYGITGAQMIANSQGGNIRYDYIQPDTQGNLRGFDLAPTGSDYTHALFPGKVIGISHQFNPNATGGDGRPGAGWGHHVFIRHVNPKTGEEYDMVYAHFPKNSIQVKVGQTVSQGQILGPMATDAQFTNDRPNVGSGDGVHMSVDMFEKDSHTPYRNWRQIGDLIRGLGRGGNQQQPQQRQIKPKQVVDEVPIQPSGNINIEDVQAIDPLNIPLTPEGNTQTQPSTGFSGIDTLLKHSKTKQGKTFSDTIKNHYQNQKG